MSLGYCYWPRLPLCVSVCVCVRQPRDCPRHNSSPHHSFTPFCADARINSPLIPARATQFGQKIKPAWLWSLLFWWAFDIDLQCQILNKELKPSGYNSGSLLHSRSLPNLRPEMEHRCSMLLLFRESIMPKISFAVNYRWLSDVAVTCQRCRASDPGSLPGLASGR